MLARRNICQLIKKERQPWTLIGTAGEPPRLKRQGERQGARFIVRNIAAPPPLHYISPLIAVKKNCQVVLKLKPSARLIQCLKDLVRGFDHPLIPCDPQRLMKLGIYPLKLRLFGP